MATSWPSSASSPTAAASLSSPSSPAATSAAVAENSSLRNILHPRSVPLPVPLSPPHAQPPAADLNVGVELDVAASPWP
ncbi:hypothetical protein NL676_012654 [Syzygium grande]|nr:hypothetical protein NL676_012654 [Syzygium grande]